jgi:protein SCO1/2
MSYRQSYRSSCCSLLLFVAGLFLLAGCATTQTERTPTPPYAGQLRGAVFQPARTLDDFSLTATTGETFTLSEHRGETLLLYFGYRTCPDFCPTTFAALKQVYEELNEPQDRLKILFVTIDPDRDTLENLTLYTQAFHEDFVGLRAEGETLEHVMEQFGVVAEKRQLADSPLSYLMDHTASLFLIGPDGRLQVQYLYGTSARDIVQDLRIILDAA